MYSQKRISTFMCLWAIYIFPESVHIFSCSTIDRLIVGIYKTLTDTWEWKLGLWPRSSFSGNICFEFSVLCFCSVGAVFFCNAYILLHELLLCNELNLRISFLCFFIYLLKIVRKFSSSIKRWRACLEIRSAAFAPETPREPPALSCGHQKHFFSFLFLFYVFEQETIGNTSLTIRRFILKAFYLD